MAQVIPEQWQVPLRFRQRIGSRAGRQRAMVDSGHLLLILHELPGTEELERTARLYWRAPDGQWRATGAGQNSGLPALKRHVESFHNAVAALDDAVDKSVEKGAVHPEPFFEVIHKATPMQRTARNLAKALQEARDGVEDKDIISLRDHALDIERAIDLVLTDAKNGMDLSIAKNAEAQAEQARRAVVAQHRLNLLAAAFFPITAVGSILGTNLHSGLEGQGPWLFWVVVGFAFALGLFLRGAVAKGG